MASIVQYKQYSGAAATTHTITLDAAATNGNDIIFLGYGDSQGYSGDCTFGGSNMTTDLSTSFGLWRIASFRVTAAGTDCVSTLAGSSTMSGIILEVSGLTTTPFESSVVKSATGEGSSTSHSCEYASGAADRIGFAFAYAGNRTFTGANGSSVLPHETTSFPSNGAIIYKDALGTGASSLDFTLNSAAACDYMLATYLTASAGDIESCLVGGKLARGGILLRGLVG